MKHFAVLFFFVLMGQLAFAQLSKRKTEIYLLVGQSNMAGRGKPEGIDTITDPAIFTFSKDEQWVPAKEPLAFDKPAVVGVGPGYAFAREISKAHPGKTIALVPGAVGGTRIDVWMPGAYDSATHTYPYDDALRRIKAALPSGELKAILWHQGESDANPRLSAAYEAKLRALIERFRDALHMPDLPFILGEIGDFKPGENPSIPVINAIIRKVAATTQHCALASAAGLTHKGDYTHFDAPSARELGKRYAEAMEGIK